MAHRFSATRLDVPQTWHSQFPEMPGEPGNSGPDSTGATGLGSDGAGGNGSGAMAVSVAKDAKHWLHHNAESGLPAPHEGQF